jgi:alternate signal-mediated exported protein
MRKSSKTKAAICGAAALAMLIGGASTFARWTEQADKDLTPVDVTTGSWTWEVSQTEEWYDISPEVTTDPWLEADGVLIGADLADFPMVPGDIVKGVIAVSIDDLVTVGTHLEAEVTAVDIDGQPVNTGFLVAVADIDDDGNLVIKIEFPYTDGDPGHLGDYEAQNGVDNGPFSVNLGSLSVTVTQVRDAYDNP